MSQMEIRDTAAGVEIRINPVRLSNLPAALVLIFWLSGWAFGEFFALVMLASAGSDWSLKIFLAVWLTFWTLGVIPVFGILIRLIGGRETIEIGRGLVRINKGFVFFKRDKRYDVFRISDLHVRPGAEAKWSPFNSGYLQFQYEGAPVRFGNGLKPQEREEVFRKFTESPDFNDRHFRAPAANPA